MILWDNSFHFYIAKLWYLFIVAEEEHIVICLSWNAFGCSRTINLSPRTSYSKDRERWRVVRRGETPLALSFSFLFVASSFLVCFVFDYTIDIWLCSFSLLTRLLPHDFVKVFNLSLYRFLGPPWTLKFAPENFLWKTLVSSTDNMAVHQSRHLHSIALFLLCSGGSERTC